MTEFYLKLSGRIIFTRLTLAEVKSAAEKSVCNKEDEIVVQCKIGLRSMIAASLLTKMGFTHVRSVDNGIVGLLAKNVKTVPNSKTAIKSL